MTRCAPWEPTASRSRRSTLKDGKIVGTKRLYADGKFGGKDGKATFFEAQWRGLQAPGKEAEKDKWPSSSTTAAPTTSGRTPISTSRRS